MNDDTHSLPPLAVELRAALDGHRHAALDAVEQCLARIEADEPAIRAWRAIDPGHARTQARRIDGRGAAGPLAGIPLAVKDIFLTQDFPTRCGSPIYEDGLAGADAACVAAARAAGAVVMGKTVTTEFAYFNPGPTANPCNPLHTPGGSSSGSAAAVASGMVPLAFGSQTAGSLIRPASYCGVFGLKATHGCHDLAGAKGLSPSLDTLGWLARGADDLELMRSALSGEAYRALPPHRQPGQLRLGVCRTWEWPAIDPAGARAFEDAERRCREAGVQVRRLELPQAWRPLAQAQKTVMAFETARSLSMEWQDHRHQLSAALRGLIEEGLACSRADYAAAQGLAQAARQELASLMDGIDALLVPSAPGAAPLGLHATGDPVFCRVWTLLGPPCVNVPGLRAPDGLPIGMQLVGHGGRDRDLLALAASLHSILSREGLQS
ncbi:amidase [Pigmentiphaga sp. H8]|uniref:amidase n=1 Tax=Pigmentiphaga sp. H8 TaxID=2488560 RepID=UPI000F599C3C|nr:amidase [Pigmentiphaga sp. H8]AZG08808.1 amidase [Pigmentiphaga sp. H8]